MIRPFYIFLFTFFIVFSSSFSKDDSDQKRLLKKATEYYKYYDYKKAKDLYVKYLKKSPDNAEANYRTGVCFDILHFESKALPYYEKAYKLDPKVKKDVLLKYSKALHSNADFDKALNYFQKYLTENKPNSKERKLVERYIFECKNGIEYKKNAIDIEVVNLGKEINSSEHDYSPLIDAGSNTLIFSSVRRGASRGNRNPLTGQLYADVYMSKKVDGNWERALPIQDINTISEEGSVYLSPDGKTMMVYVGISETNSDLFYTRKRPDSTWGELILLSGSVNLPNSREVSACMSEDQLTLVFSSNRSGGKGELDLYYSNRKSKSDDWREPINMSSLNTEYDEDSPFLDVDGTTLYFCSKGHNGMGQFDIYRAKYDRSTEAWSEPENLGYPVNSPGNDIFFILSSDGKYAYFNSAKEGGFGGQDIYRMTMPEEIKTRGLDDGPDFSSNNFNKISLKGQVVGQTFNAPISDVKVIVAKSDGSVLKTIMTDIEGNFSCDLYVNDFEKLMLITDKLGYNKRSEELIVNANSDIYEKTIHIEEPTNLVNNIQSIRPKRVSNNLTKIVSRKIYFDFNSSIINNESKVELDKVFNSLQNNPAKRILIEGHTDAVGSEENNLLVSEMRSKAILKYLLSKGIDENRIAAKGYGESKPLVSNDDEEGREINRRIEFVFQD